MTWSAVMWQCAVWDLNWENDGIFCLSGHRNEKQGKKYNSPLKTLFSPACCLILGEGYLRFSMNSFYFSYQDFKHRIQSQHSKWKKSIFRISEKKFWSFWEMHQNAKIKCLNDRSRKQIISYQTTDPLVQNPTQYIKQREFQANEGKE